MGECINLRRGGKKKVLPILNANYPADATVEYGGSASFSVKIATDGYPAKYTYQWYIGGEAIAGATSPTFAPTGLAADTYTVYCRVTNDAGTVLSRFATYKINGPLPSYTYSGSHQLIDDGNGNWRLKLTTSGKLKFTSLGTAKNGIDFFMVGGGGAGSEGGGGGGYCVTHKGQYIATGTEYSIVIGAGGERTSSTSASGSDGKAGGDSTAFGYAAAGGRPGNGSNGGAGGSGGGGMYANGGSNGSKGESRTSISGGGSGGAGQSTVSGYAANTYEFGEVVSNTNFLYAGGGGGGAASATYASGAGGAGGGGEGGNNSGSSLHKGDGHQGTDGRGGGGGGRWSNYYSGRGGSGIVIIRNKR